MRVVRNSSVGKNFILEIESARSKSQIIIIIITIIIIRIQTYLQYEAFCLFSWYLVSTSVVCADDNSLCTVESCSNGGDCIQEWNTFRCDCDLTSFTGPTCDDGNPKYLLIILVAMIVVASMPTMTMTINNNKKKKKPVQIARKTARCVIY